MILYANGCSMTYGAELSGETIVNGVPVENDSDYREQHSFPNILGKLIKIENVINDAIGGGGNDRIFRTTMEWTSKYLQNNDGKNLFVVIGWSSPERTEYRINDTWVSLLPHFSPIHALQNVLDLHKFHVDIIMDDRRDYTASINYMLSLQSWFKINSIRFIFFNALHIRWPKITEIQILREHIDNNYYKFDNEGFCMSFFCDDYPCGSRHHPLEEGHRQWANALYQYIIDNKLIR